MSCSAVRVIALNSALLLAMPAALADKYTVDPEPESPATLCERDSGGVSVSECIRLMRKIEAHQQHPAPQTTGDKALGALAVLAPFLLLWFIFFRRK